MNTIPHRSFARRGVRVALGATLIVAALAGCGSDDDASESLSPAACDAFTAITAAMFGDPAGVESAAEALVDGTSADLQDAARVYADATVAALSGDATALEGDDVAEATEDVGAAASETCESVNRVDVTGVDFAFEGVPETLDAGRTAFDFTNGTDSGEAHEMVILRRVDGADDTVTELLELPEDELFSKVIPTAVVFADDAGATSHALVDLEPGSYIAVCMIPTAGDGPPHVVNGMVDEFAVS
jgi:hypothetical protein